MFEVLCRYCADEPAGADTLVRWLESVFVEPDPSCAKPLFLHGTTGLSLFLEGILQRLVDQALFPNHAPVHAFWWPRHAAPRPVDPEFVVSALEDAPPCAAEPIVDQLRHESRAARLPRVCLLYQTEPLFLPVGRSFRAALRLFEGPFCPRYAPHLLIASRATDEKARRELEPFGDRVEAVRVGLGSSSSWLPDSLDLRHEVRCYGKRLLAARSWAAVRAHLRARRVAFYWHSLLGKHMGPGGKLRALDRAAYEADAGGCPWKRARLERSPAGGPVPWCARGS